MRIGLRSRWGSPGALAVAALLLSLAACAPKPVTLRVQGTVQTVGSRIPIAGAKVLIQWPGTLGGGESHLTSDHDGHFVTGRTLRRRNLDCSGLTLTVQVEGFASAYERHDVKSCGKDAVLNFTVNMLRQAG